MTRSLSQKALIIAAGTGIRSVLSQVAVNFCLVRIMDTQVEFGIYRQVWLVVNTAIPVFIFGLDLALYFYLPNLAHDKRRSFLRRTFAFLFFSGVLLSALLFLGSRFIASWFGAPEVAPLLKALAPYVLFGVPAAALFDFLIAQDRPILAVLYNVGFLIVQAGLTVALIAIGVPMHSVFYVLGALMAVRLAHAVFEVRRLTSGSWGERIPVSASQHVRYALPVGFTATMAMLGGRIDKFVVASFLGPAVYAWYSVGALEFPGVVLLDAAAATVLRIRCSRLHHSADVLGIVHLCAAASRKLGLVLIPLGFWLAIFSREIIIVLYTEEYVKAAPVFRIYLTLILFRLFPLEPVLSSLGRTRIVFTGGVLFLLVDLGLNLVAVRAFGVFGPPIATVAATAGLMCYYAVQAARTFQLSFVRMFPVLVLARIALVSAAAGLASWPVLWMPWPSLPKVLAGLAVFGAVYLAIGLGTRTIRRGDIEIVTGLAESLELGARGYGAGSS